MEGTSGDLGRVASESDERTANNTDAVRHNYRVLSDNEKADMVRIKDAGQALLEVIPISTERPGANRCFALARTKAEEAVMWAVKGITS